MPCKKYVVNCDHFVKHHIHFWEIELLNEKIRIQILDQNLLNLCCLIARFLLFRVRHALVHNSTSKHKLDAL